MDNQVGHRVLLAGALLFGGPPLESQQLGAPSYRPQDAVARATSVLDEISTFDRTARTARRVLVDTLRAGVVWIDRTLRNAERRTGAHGPAPSLALMTREVFCGARS